MIFALREGPLEELSEFEDNSALEPGPEGTESHFSEAETNAVEFTPTKLKTASGEEGETTVRRMLSAYEIGRKLRQLRLKKKIGLVDLGRHTGLSASMLSQLENGKLIPTLPTLARIAMVFDVGVDHFFVNKRGKYLFSVVRAQDRLRFPADPDSAKPSYFFESLAYPVQEKSIQCYMAEFPKRVENDGAEHSHPGAEFLHVIEGQLEIRYHDEVTLLYAGDSVYFDASEEHAYRGVSKVPARALVVTVLPRV